MAEIFVSYAAEDGEVARYVAQGLKAEGYDVWYYQGDGQTPGADYLDNIGDGVRQARVVVLFVSPHAIKSPQCNSEAQIAWEESKKVIPLLRGLSFDQLKADPRGKRWADRIGTRVSIQIDAHRPENVLGAVLAGVRAARPSTAATPPTFAPSPAFTAPAAAPLPSTPPAGTSSAGKIVAGAAGALGFYFCFGSFLRVLSPPTAQEVWLLRTFPAVKVANLLVNLLGLAQNAGLIYGAWLLHRGDPKGAPLLRKVALSILATVGLWFLACFFTFGFSHVPQRVSMIGGALLLASFAIVPAIIVFRLFRNARQ